MSVGLLLACSSGAFRLFLEGLLGVVTIDDSGAICRGSVGSTVVVVVIVVMNE